MNSQDREYEDFEIFEQIRFPGEAQPSPPGETVPAPAQRQNPLPQQKRQQAPQNLQEDLFYEIEYDSCPMPGVGRFVLKSTPIDAPKRDEIRDIFDQMRDIARESRAAQLHSVRFYDRRVQQENARIFYQQALFMEDFEDKYTQSVPCSAYYPNYQMMGYGQLRTYFTWRTHVRGGDIAETSLSYAFMYIYELLNNIGTDSPQDGLKRLMTFWKAFRNYHQALDRYMPGWLKDYYIYYELPGSFAEFVSENDLGAYYPNLSDPGDDFQLLCSLSKYDIRKSAFYTPERSSLIEDCFRFVFAGLEQTLAEKQIRLRELLFYPSGNMSVWLPFKGALFYPHGQQRDRQIVLSEKEIYRCSRNTWTFSAVITADSGKRLIGYIAKQTEAVLRKLTNYKYKLSADPGMLSPATADMLQAAGISPEAVITDAVTAFYRESTKTVVRVDPAALDKIRREALDTQEKLIVPEEEAANVLTNPLPSPAPNAASDTSPAMLPPPAVFPTAASSPDVSADAASPAAPWTALRRALSNAEAGALSAVLRGGTDFTEYADRHGIMPEVLADDINEKAMDFIGDSLLDNEFEPYEDYIEQIKEMVKEI
ncbi:MAG: hypothetical protein HDR26_08625 [Lachnospiraceae bacterium]|nr:hypothetical protein [Lachnospiraceae bacterium]